MGRHMSNALIRMAAQLPKGSNERRTILAALIAQDVAETISRIKEATDDNYHTDAVLMVAGLLERRTEWRVLVSLKKIHDELGYMPQELITFRESILRDLLQVAKAQMTPGQYATLRSLF